jgi:hypothetical protein
LSQQLVENEEVLDPYFRFVVGADNVPNHCVQVDKPPSKEAVNEENILWLSMQGVTCDAVLQKGRHHFLCY